MPLCFIHTNLASKDVPSDFVDRFSHKVAEVLGKDISVSVNISTLQYKFRHLKWRFWNGVPMGHKDKAMEKSVNFCDP